MAEISAPAKGARRHLIYIHGFDLRGPAQYHGLMAAELARYGAIRGIEAEVSAPEPALLDPSAHWRMEGGGRSCEVHYLGWHDLVKARLRLGLGARLWRGAGAMLEIAFAGPALTMARRNWPTALFFLYPFAIMLAAALALLAPTLWLVTAGSWAAAPVGAGLAILAHRVLWRIEGRSYFWYLLQDHISIRDFAKGRDAGMAARVDAFAERIAELIDRAGPEEDVVIAAHSSGTFVALRAVDRLLTRWPDIGAGRARRPILLTLGSAFGYTGFYPGATTGREARRVIESRRILWTDVYSLKDSICCGRFDPAAEFGVEAKGPGRPHLVNARLNHRLNPALYQTLRQSVFAFHFGYLHAMSDVDGFDFYDVAISEDPWASVLRASNVAPAPLPDPPPEGERGREP